MAKPSKNDIWLGLACIGCMALVFSIIPLALWFDPGSIDTRPNPALVIQKPYGLVHEYQLEVARSRG